MSIDLMSFKRKNGMSLKVIIYWLEKLKSDGQGVETDRLPPRFDKRGGQNGYDVRPALGMRVGSRDTYPFGETVPTPSFAWWFNVVSCLTEK